MNYDHISLTVVDAVATLTFCRPRVLNAFNEQQRVETRHALGQIEADPSVRAVIITGSGTRAFSSGQDIDELATGAQGSAESWIGSWDSLYAQVSDLGVPTIAALNGYAVGAGLQLALLTDIRVAADHARIGMTEINLGIPAITGAATMWHLTSASVIQDAILTGRLMDANEARGSGLITRVVPGAQLSSYAKALAGELATKSDVAIRSNKEWWRQLRGQVMEEAALFAKEAHAQALASDHSKGAIASF